MVDSSIGAMSSASSSSFNSHKKGGGWKNRRPKVKNIFRLGHKKTDSLGDVSTVTIDSSVTAGNHPPVRRVDSILEPDDVVNLDFFYKKNQTAQTHDAQNRGNDDELDERFSHLTNLVKSTLIRNHNKSNTSTTTWQKTSTLLAAKDKLIAAMNQDYVEILLDQADQGNYNDHETSGSGTSDIHVHLLAASHLLGQFVNLETTINEETSLPERVSEMIFETIQDFIRPRLVDQYSQPFVERLSPGDAAETIVWIESVLLETTIQDTYPHLTPSSKWLKDRDLLVDLYMDRAVRQEMQLMIGRCRDMYAVSSDPNESLDSSLSSADSAASTSALRKDANGNMVSSMPEEVAFMVESQIKTAMACLPETYIPRVLAICNEELRCMIGDLMLTVGTQWKDLSSRWYCAIINDAMRLSRQCETRNAKYFAADPDGTKEEDGETSDLDRFRAEGNMVAQEFHELSFHAAAFLSERVISHLREPQPILTTVGSASWADDEDQSVIETTIATLNDYLVDIDRWLIEDDFFAKVLKECFSGTLRMYVESFFANTMAHGLSGKDAATFAHELDRDYLRLVIFFNGKNFETFHSSNGYYKPQTVNSKLHVIRCISKLINPEVTADDATGEVKFLLNEFKGSHDGGASAIFHLVGLRKKHSSHEAVEWLRVVSSAKKTLAQEQINMLTKKETPEKKLKSSFLARGSSARNRVRRASKSKADVSKSARESLTSSRGSGIEVQEAVTFDYKLPDLRNSRYLYNVRPRRHEIHRRISADTMQFTGSIRKLLEKPTFKVPRRRRVTPEVYTPSSSSALDTESEDPIKPIATAA